MRILARTHARAPCNFALFAFTTFTHIFVNRSCIVDYRLFLNIISQNCDCKTKYGQKDRLKRGQSLPKRRWCENIFISISSEQIRRFLGFPNFSRTSLQNSQRFARKCPTFFVVTPWYLYQNYDFLLPLCEGCESKKCKIPVVCAHAHAHAWAGNGRLIFHLVFLIWWEDCFVLLIFSFAASDFSKILARRSR